MMTYAGRCSLWTRALKPNLRHAGQMSLVSRYPFLATARPAQKPPDGNDWTTWLFLGGRGAGKTRAGAEWIRFQVRECGMRQIALVGPTLHDAREVMVEGPSGLRAIERDRSQRPVYQVSRRRLIWPNGAVAQIFSAEEPDRLRGPQFQLAWCDEVAAWPRAETVWDTLQMGLRLGPLPRCVATTTPRPIALIKRLMSGEAAVTQSTTHDNARFLASSFIAKVEGLYGGSVLGRQELLGEVIDDPRGALWSRSVLEDCHRVSAPPLEEVIVAIDPPATIGANADACGIIAAGRDALGQGYVLADATAQGLAPLEWASRAIALAEAIGASQIVAEANQGGEMVRTVLQQAGCRLPIALRTARLSKHMRAVPIAAMYNSGRVFHVGVHRDLEDEMCRFGRDGFAGSPDRVDALVWALDAVFGCKQASSPRIRAI